jgi:hypothetical protein
MNSTWPWLREQRDSGWHSYQLVAFALRVWLQLVDSVNQSITTAGVQLTVDMQEMGSCKSEVRCAVDCLVLWV